MTFIFPFVGWRGGFFHSGAAFQTLFWCMVPVGLELTIRWGVKHRQWIQEQATVVFSAGLIILTVLLTCFIVSSRVLGPDFKHPAWNENNARYVEIEDVLNQVGAGKDDVVLVNNAPGYFAATRRSAISIPDGDLDILLRVASKYGATYLIVEYDHPSGLDQIYKIPTDYPGIKFLRTVGSSHIFRIVE
jgi:hypothetical protein